MMKRTAMKMMVIALKKKKKKCTSLHINVDARIGHHEFDGGLADEVRRRRRTRGAWTTKATRGRGKARASAQRQSMALLSAALEQRRDEEMK
jgi:hypothetical protein